MKTSMNGTNFYLALFLPVVLILSSFSLVKAQESKDEKSGKTEKARVVVKIKKENDKNSTVIDTTFNLANKKEREQFEKYMKNYESDLGKLNEKMNNLELMVTLPDLKDSLGLDSLGKEFNFNFNEDGMSQFFRNKCPRGCYSFDFAIPDIPEVNINPGDFEKEFNLEVDPGAGHQWRFRGGGENTLSDILGDIPMDRVKSYVIKDRKNGKRIIIDVEDEPLVRHHERTVIMGNGGRHNRMYMNPGPHPRVEKRVIIKSGEDTPDQEKTETKTLTK